MNPPLRTFIPTRSVAAVITALCCAALLWPGHRAGSFTLAAFLSPPSDLADLSEITAHLLIFTLITWLWYRALESTIHPLRTTVTVGVLLAFGTEFAQIFVQRGVSIFDLGANIAGISLTSIMIRRAI